MHLFISYTIVLLALCGTARGSPANAALARRALPGLAATGAAGPTSGRCPLAVAPPSYAIVGDDRRECYHTGPMAENGVTEALKFQASRL
jgi:hypothetical protein